MSNADKGKFSADISNDVIREALESVKRHTGAPTDEVEPVDIAKTDPAPQPPAEAVHEVEAQTPDAAAADHEAALKELETLRAQLEFSQAKGRELMEKLKDQHERMLRAAADLENYKKRAQKEKEEVQKFGAEMLVEVLHTHPKVLLDGTVIDNPHYLPPRQYPAAGVAGKTLTSSRSSSDSPRLRNRKREISRLGSTRYLPMHNSRSEIAV